MLVSPIKQNCVCDRDGDTVGVKMALASGHWLEKEIKGEAPSPR